MRRTGIALLLLTGLAATAHAATPANAAKTVVERFSTGRSIADLLHASTRKNLDGKDPDRQSGVIFTLGAFLEASVEKAHEAEKRTIVTDFRCGSSPFTLEETMIGLGDDDDLWSISEVLAFAGPRPPRGQTLEIDREFYDASLEMLGFLVDPSDIDDNNDVAWTVPHIIKPEFQRQVRALCPDGRATVTRSATIVGARAFEIEVTARHAKGLAHYRVFTETNGEVLMLQLRSTDPTVERPLALPEQKVAAKSMESRRDEFQTSVGNWEEVILTGKVEYFRATPVEKSLESARAGLLEEARNSKQEGAEKAVRNYLDHHVPKAERVNLRVDDTILPAIPVASANAAANAILKFMERWLSAPTLTPDLEFDSEPAKAKVTIMVGTNADTRRWIDATKDQIKKVWIGIYTGTIEKDGIKGEFPVDLVNDDRTSWRCTLDGSDAARKWSCKPTS